MPVETEPRRFLPANDVEKSFIPNGSIILFARLSVGIFSNEKTKAKQHEADAVLGNTGNGAGMYSGEIITLAKSAGKPENFTRIIFRNGNIIPNWLMTSITELLFAFPAIKSAIVIL